ncbi:MAG: glutamine synthetase III [Kiritimatiellia bacterium]
MSSSCTCGTTKLGQFGANVFSLKTMRNYLSENAYQKLVSTIVKGEALDHSIADEVADAMKTWALEKGATHFTHLFQPLTGVTAEKHEAFLMPDGEGGSVATFSGKELIQGEPDASSFPSGGLRATFEARGYTAWDPTSPAFVRENPKGGCVLCIPTVFCGWHGDALDKKTGLLRSQHALATQLSRMGKLFGIKAVTRPFATLGPEQEYFLIDKTLFDKRLDLLQTGRTLFGSRPARHQQMEDHYFGHIKPRIMAFMDEVNIELWKLGVPARTQHNEVSPAQFEIAPIFEEQNLAIDHNVVTMHVLQEVAERHGLVCVLHEKPFAGVNGSGKHNNWSIVGPDGKNWLSPGQTPHENAKFLTMLCIMMKAVDTHAALLRMAVASAGNDHRLGANEAPPAIISIFLGEQLTDIIEQVEKGGAKSSKSAGHIEIGVSTLPKLPRDATDRNRTSPMAFTGNKFEFRAVGSSQSCAGANVVLNTIAAWAMDELCTEIEAKMAETRKDLNSVLQGVLQGIIRQHKRILFDGDNYTAEWKAEAARRGLPNLIKTPEALAILEDKKTIALLEKYGVFSARETKSRYEVYMHAYQQTVSLEGYCALRMARTMIIPAAYRYLAELGSAQAAMPKGASAGIAGTIKEVAALSESLNKLSAKLEKALHAHDAAATLETMLAMRTAADTLENLTPASLWPLPSYAELLFLM